MSGAAPAVAALVAVACSGEHSTAADAMAPAAPDGAVDATGGGSDRDGSALDAGACQPMDVSGFTPPAYLSARRSGACAGFGGDAGLVQAYGDACIGHAASYASCKSFAPGGFGGAGGDPDSCYRCLVTPLAPDAGAYGAVLQGAVPIVNYPGCVELLDPSAAGVACAHSIFSAFACAQYACVQSCPIVDDVSLRAFVSCTNAAFDGPCFGYALALQACLASEQGDGGTPVAQTCFAGMTAEDHYSGFAAYLCGTN